MLRAETLTSGLDVLYVGPATVDTEIWDRMIDESADTSWRQAHGATPAAIARKTVKAIRRGSASLAPGLIPKSVGLVNRLFPGVVQWVLAHKH